MITLYGFGRVNSKVIGQTRDLRVQWALEEVGLPYQVKALDHPAGDTKTETFRALSPFEQLPVLDDDGYVLTETGAITLYVAEKAGKLIPSDFKGRMQVTRWSFAVLNTLELATMELAMIELMGTLDATGPQRRPKVIERLHRWLFGIEHWLSEHRYLANAEFSVADLLLTNVLRQLRGTGVLARYPRIESLRALGEGRPAWRRACRLYEQRLGVEPGFVR